MNFILNNTTAASTSNVKKTLDGNAIHKVIFKGCEAVDITGKDEKKYKLIKIRFENEEGVFEDSVFEPSEADFKRPQSAQGYEQPSGFEYLMTKMRHLIAAVNPDLDKQIDSGEKSLSAPDWNKFRELIVRATNKGKDAEVEIKLMKNKNGYSIFPRYFLGLSKEGNVYIKKGNGFIGHGLYFTEKELEVIEKQANAKPTDMSNPAVKKTEPIVSQIQNDDFDDLDL